MMTKGDRTATSMVSGAISGAPLFITDSETALSTALQGMLGQKSDSKSLKDYNIDSTRDNLEHICKSLFNDLNPTQPLRWQLAATWERF